MEITFYESSSHLISAAMSADQVRSIERELREGDENPGGYSEIPPAAEHAALVQSCIMSSFAYLEAFVNETWDESQNQDQIRSYLSFNNQLTSNTEFTQYSTLAKYQALLVSAGNEPFPKGEAPFQEVAWLKELRNYWVHYEPDSITTEDSPREAESKLASALRDRVERNPIYPEEEEPYLPRLAISYNCCQWAIESSIDFVEDFRSKFGSRRSLPYLNVVESILEESDR